MQKLNRRTENSVKVTAMGTEVCESSTGVLSWGRAVTVGGEGGGGDGIELKDNIQDLQSLVGNYSSTAASTACPLKSNLVPGRPRTR